MKPGTMLHGEPRRLRDLRPWRSAVRATDSESSLPHVVVVIGEGGHSKECLRLVDLMGQENYQFTYILESQDQISRSQLRVPGPVHRVVRPTCVVKRHPIRDSLKLLWCALQAAAVLIRARPDALVSTGPAVVVPVSLVAKLLGARIFYVETGSRIHTLSTTGKIMRHIADHFFVQWEELLPAAPPGAIFAGRLF
jgi:beta-1,4-N-acetylglucosaminyltransferase